MPSTRTVYLGFLIACVTLLGFGLFLEHVKGLEPCPLCMLQRVAYVTIALIALVAAIHNPGRLVHRIYSGLITLAALCGAGVASRQVWLQHLPPDQVPECGPGIEYMLESFPFGEALKMILMGSGECAEVLWRFLWLSIPEWSLVFFIGLSILGIVSLFRKIE